MPQTLPTAAIEAAEAAVEFAQSTRRYHRRRTDPLSKQRQRDIARALERLKEAMKPLKSAIGGFQYGPQTSIAEQNRHAILAASAAIQRERRKLWKLSRARTSYGALTGRT